jgi:hypothetical protein
MVRVDVPKENPPPRHDKSFRLGHSLGATAHALQVRLAFKILLTVLGHPSHHMSAERRVGCPQNQDVPELRRNAINQAPGRNRPRSVDLGD